MFAEKVESLGELLRKMRSAQQISQEHIAAKAGVARSTLIRWERGIHQPRLPELMGVLDVLGASPLLREQALTLLSAPRATHHLREQRDSTAEQGAEGIHIPNIGDLLRAMRLRWYQTQEQIADQMGVRRNTLSRWEGGELIPSPERLDQLLTLLGAHPEERTVLTQARLLPSLSTDIATTSLDELVNRLQHIALGAYDANLEALKDLEYLRLEARLAQMASRRITARRFLLETYSWHAQWLVGNRRYREAESYANQALEMGRKEAFSGLHELRATLVAACCAVNSGEHPRPERGVELLQQLLPLNSPPEYEAWVYGDMARYLKQAGRTGQALDLSARACRVALRCENSTELRCRRVDRAEILLQTTQPHDVMHALELLPIDHADHPGGRVREALLWSAGLLTVGETSEAQDWLGRASAVVQEYHLDPTEVDTLAKRF